MRDTPAAYPASAARRRSSRGTACAATGSRRCSIPSESRRAHHRLANYLGNLTASFRALYERLIFQNLTYNKETPCCNGRPIPVLLIMTSNAPEGMYDEMLKGYKASLDRFVGPTEIFVCGDTLQLADYSKTDWEWSLFDPERKKQRRETVFPLERKAAFEKGAGLAGS